MKRPIRSSLRELLFRCSLLLKGLDAVLELAGGVALWLLSPAMIVNAVAFLTQDEVTENRHDVVALYLRAAADRLSLSSEHFMAAYLFAHGAVKILVVIAVLKNKLWGYPLAIVVFSGFVAYQIYRYSLFGGAGLIALSLFDVIVIVLVWLEYRAKSHPPSARSA
jgi:uncharacterized membrane protein